jgi:hypothetical protein
MTNSVADFSTLTQPSFGIPATAATFSTIFSISAVLYDTAAFGKVVVVVVVVVVVALAGGIVVTTGTVVVVVELTTATTGSTVSIVRVKAALGAEVLPAASVRVAVTLHTPSDNNGKSQLDTDADATKEHVTVTSPFVALTSTVSPTARPVKLISGVLSEVMLSVEERPVSDAASRFGTESADTDPAIRI